MSEFFDNLFSKEILTMDWSAMDCNPFTIPERLIGTNHDKAIRLVNGMILKYGLLIPILKPGAEILDMCCGSGFGSNFLSRSGFKVDGIDRNEKAIKVAQLRTNENLVFKRGNIFKEPIAKKYDAVILVDAIEHFYQKDQLFILKKCYDWLKPGGWFLIDTPLSKESKRESRHHLWVLNWKDFGELFCLSGNYTDISRYSVGCFKEKHSFIIRSDVDPGEYLHTDQIILGQRRKINGTNFNS